MCYKKKKPVRLNKIQEPWWIETGKWIIKQPNFWIYIIFGIIFAILIFIAIHEATTYFVYNRGGI